MPSLINRTQLKKFILAKVKSETPGNHLTRVSAQALDAYEAILRARVIRDVKSHPTIGKTFTEVY